MKKKMAYFRRFWVKKTIFAKKRYTSIVAKKTVAGDRYSKIKGLLQADTGQPLQVSLVGRFHVGHSLVCTRYALVLLIVPHTPRTN